MGLNCRRHVGDDILPQRCKQVSCVQETTLEKKEFSYICLIHSDALVSTHTNEEIPFEVCKSVHHHTIQIIQPTRCNSFTSLLLDVYVWLNMF